MKEIVIWSWIIIDKQKRILLIKRKYNKKEFPRYWSFPWWHKEKNENIENCVIREVKEETGLDFKIDKIFIENKFMFDDNDKITHFYRFIWEYSWEIKIQDSECDWYAWFNYEETKSLVIFEIIREVIEKLFKENLIV